MTSRGARVCSGPGPELEQIGRYVLFPPIAYGGMATVHPARLVAEGGFQRLVAVKRLHPEHVADPELRAMLQGEARIASRIHHPNVVPVLDIVVANGELVLVQELVHGVSLSQLLRACHTSEAPVPLDIAVAILGGVLSGLHAAHEVRDEDNRPLDVVHRDVSPQNVMVSVDGVPRLLDFGIAKARTSTEHTRDGVLKGKLAYMAPEQMCREPLTRTADLYAVGVLAWEMLVNRRIYDGRPELEFMAVVMAGQLPPITAAIGTRETLDEERLVALVHLEPIVRRAMALAPSERFTTATEMRRALEKVCRPASALTVSSWVERIGAPFLEQRERTLAQNEQSWQRIVAASPIEIASPISGTRLASSPHVMTPSGPISILATIGAARARSTPPPLPTTRPPPPSDVNEKDDEDESLRIEIESLRSRSWVWLVDVLAVLALALVVWIVAASW